MKEHDLHPLQWALDSLEADAVQWNANRHWNKEKGFYIDDEGIEQAIANSKLLQPIVDRAIPKAPVRKFRLFEEDKREKLGECVCGFTIHEDDHFCSNCGQALVFGDES